MWGPNTDEQSRDFLARAAAFRLEHPRRTFELGFVLRGSGLLIGAGGIRVKSEVHLDGDIGYTIRRDPWGNGYGSEAARALVEFGFRELGLHRIWATCHVQNVRSARVLEAIGMQQEGLLRKNMLQRGAWRDSYLYAILREDSGVA